MSIAVAHGYDAQVIGLEDAGHAGPPSKRIITGYGFWIFLLSDIVMFSCFFAAYAVLLGQTAGGPSGAELFNLRNVAIETAFLLLSSFACGMASIAAEVRSHLWFYIAMAVTCLLGLGFLVIEFREFADLIARAKANPNELNYASPGIGTTPHLSAELLKIEAGIQLTHVPFSGAGPAIQAILSGTTQLAFAALPPAHPLIESGALKALAEASGGLDYYPKDLAEVDRITPEVAHELRNQYILGYTPTNLALDGTFRKVEIHTTKKDYKIQARSGYYAVPKKD